MSDLALLATVFGFVGLYTGYPVLVTAARFFIGRHPLRGHRHPAARLPPLQPREA